VSFAFSVVQLKFTAEDSEGTEGGDIDISSAEFIPENLQEDPTAEQKEEQIHR
jgi:hypothetical protein